MSREVAALQDVAYVDQDLDADGTSASDLYNAAKATLGNAFGTRKAQNQLRARERNQVKATSLVGAEAILDSIHDRAELLPSQRL